VPRRTATALLAVLVLLAAACSGDGGSDGSDGSVRPDRALPPPLVAFLDRVAAPGSVAFSAGYDVLYRLGNLTTPVQVTSAPPQWRIDARGVTVIDGPEADRVTCRAPSCQRGVHDQQLMSNGVFSRFYSTGPAAALRAAARRDGADAPVFTTASMAGIKVDCVSINIAGAPLLRACLTPEGVFALVDDAARRVALTSYSTARPPAITPPYPLR
jgi:hypothetical protein